MNLSAKMYKRAEPNETKIAAKISIFFIPQSKGGEKCVLLGENPCAAAAIGCTMGKIMPTNGALKIWPMPGKWGFVQYKSRAEG